MTDYVLQALAKRKAELERQVEVLAKRNGDLHVGLRNALDDRPGWRDAAIELLMNPPFATEKNPDATEERANDV